MSISTLVSLGVICGIVGVILIISSFILPLVSMFWGFVDDYAGEILGTFMVLAAACLISFCMIASYVNYQMDVATHEAKQLKVVKVNEAQGKVINIQNTEFGTGTPNTINIKMKNGNTVNLDVSQLNAKKKVSTSKSDGNVDLSGFGVGVPLLVGVGSVNGQTNSTTQTTDNQPASNYLLNTPYEGLRISTKTFTDLKPNDSIQIVQQKYVANKEKLNKLKELSYYGDDGDSYHKVKNIIAKHNAQIKQDKTVNGIIVKDNK